MPVDRQKNFSVNKKWKLDRSMAVRVTSKHRRWISLEITKISTQIKRPAEQTIILFQQ
jgi:hypothetical protein